MKKQVEFIRGIETKYDVDTHITNLQLLELADLIQTFENDLQKVRDKRALTPERTQDYVELSDSELDHDSGDEDDDED